jgi:beta-lactamase class A
MHISRYIGSGCVTLVAGVALGTGGVYAFQNFSQLVVRVSEIREVKRADTSLTSPLLECAELSSSVSDKALLALRRSLEKLVADRSARGDITYASIYLRDLTAGPWLGINESEAFFPASLLKLPLAMSFYNAAEDNPAILDALHTYTKDPLVEAEIQPFEPGRNVVPGQKYTTKELIDIMLQESSNQSAVTLADVAGASQIKRVYHDLGLEEPVFGQDYKINTHKYASFFRILYNATYLDRTDSEKILQVLTKTSFQDGLAAGVPEGIAVAHKFGSRQVDAAGNIVQLHDCGIIYATGKPYVLCVMTQGSDFTKLATFIKDTSALVYKNISSTK